MIFSRISQDFFFGKKFINKPFLKLSPNKTWEGFIGATFWTILFGIVFADFLARYEWFTCPRVDVTLFSPLHCDILPVFQSTISLPESIIKITNLIGWDIMTVRPIVLHSIVLSLFGSLIAPFGGFFASAIKRAYNKKDFDNIIPGHGGFTDRTDCQYIMGLFTYVYYHLFIQDIDVYGIIELALALPLEQQITLLQKLNDTITLTLANTSQLYKK